ncbi:tetratricopeptide repeat protein [Flavisphingomonas formosensis]|uniref:tetratricopeptide repeat protein n=1 Tax=Flavisphingomonas formosensis TaxID=861534 RepID=UPI0012F8F3BD|nr:tetratricopeptide repeat protein [Sphingomonas formosensis]
MAGGYRLAALLVVAMAAFPVEGAVIVSNGGDAQRCYEAASATKPNRAGIRVCTRAIARVQPGSREHVATIVNRGIIRMETGAIGDAIADFDQAIALDPQEPEAWLNKGFAVLNLPDGAASAKAMFDTALDKQSRRPELAYYGRALAEEDLGNLRAAYLDYQRAIAIAPDWDAPQRELTRFQVVPKVAPSKSVIGRG